MNPFAVFSDKDKQETRAGFGDGIFEIAQVMPEVVVLTADLAGSLKLSKFIKAFPDRFFQCGVAEANMMGIAAGLTIGGKIPFTTSFANFSTGRVYDQIRQSIAYSHKNVKICASHAGLTLGEDGATHQILEDIGLMRMLPGMTVIAPCDYHQTKAAVKAIAQHKGPCYLRFGRPKWPNFTNPDEPLTIGKAQLLVPGSDITLVATGHMVWKAIEAGRHLFEKGISVELINMHTIKPLDQDTLLASVRKTGCVVTAEEHMIHGGLGDAVASVLALHYPVPMGKVAVNDTFGESGKPDELLKKYGLDWTNIVHAVLRTMARSGKTVPA